MGDGAGHGGERGEHDAGRVVRTLQLLGEEVQPDITRRQLLGEQGEHGEFDPAAGSLVLVDGEGHGDAAGADLPASFAAASSSGRLSASAPGKQAAAKPIYRRWSPRSVGWSAMGPESGRRRVAWREPSRLRDWALGLPGSAW